MFHLADIFSIWTTILVLGHLVPGFGGGFIMLPFTRRMC